MSHPSDRPPLVLYPNWKGKVRWLVGLLSGLAILIFGLVMVSQLGGRQDLWFISAVGGVIVVSCLLVSRHVFYPEPIFVLDKDGLTDRSSPFGMGVVGRDEIEAVVVFQHGGRGMLGVKVRDKQAV